MFDIGTWEEFRVGSLFQCETTKGIPSKNDLKTGDIPYVTRSAENNGLSGTCGNTSHINKGNCITIGAEGFVAFWQDDNFVAGNKVYAIRHKKMNKLSGLFVCAALNVLSCKYSFKEARILDKIKNEIIKLPVVTPPDWEELEKFLSDGGIDMSKIDTSTWKEYRIGDLFEIRPTKNYGLTNVLLFENEGEVPVVVNSSVNNGIGGYVSLEPTEQGNVITFSDTTDANSIFYQEKPFVGYSHVQVMVPKYEEMCSPETLQYIATCFKEKALTYEFDYGNKFRRDIAQKIKILLPPANNENEDPEPDWGYMESYMESVVEDCKRQFELLIKCAKERNKINIKEWKEFALSDLFAISTCKSVDKVHLDFSDDGEYDFIGRTSVNNGIQGKLNRLDFNPNKAGSFSVTQIGERICQYRENDWYASQNIFILAPKEKELTDAPLSVSEIITEMLKNKYGDEAYAKYPTLKSLNADTILLPRDENGRPDYSWLRERERESIAKMKGVVESLSKIILKKTG